MNVEKFKEDKQIITRPDCEGCGKKEAGLVIVNGLILCGECVMKLQKQASKRTKMILEELKGDKTTS